jgi:response regulator RpfG family c-di-GMP phosphodiesterase
MNQTVLFVDDDPNILGAMQRQLHRRYKIDVALGGEKGLAMIRDHGPYAVVIADMRMPVMDGIQFLSRVQSEAKNTVRMMLTGNADQQTAIDAVNQGHIFRFLNKPCPPETLLSALEAGFEQYRLVTSEEELLQKTLTGSVRILTELLSSADPDSYRRAQKLRRYARELAAIFPVENKWEMELAAMLSPIGQIAMPADLINKVKSGRILSDEETSVWENAPQVAHDLLINIPRMETIALCILYHHKKFNGEGVPHDHLTGDMIPLSSRLLKVLDDLTQLESEGYSMITAFRLLRSRSGWYDPSILDGAWEYFAKRDSMDNGAVGKGADALRNMIDAFDSAPLGKKVCELHVGDVLAEDISLQDGRLLLSTGTILTALLLEKIRNFHHLHAVSEPIYVLA